MKYTNATSLTTKMLFNKVRQTVIVIVFSTVIFTAMTICSLLTSLSDFFEKSVNNRIDARTVYVSYDSNKVTEDYVLKELNNMEHVIIAIPDQSKNIGAICEPFLNYSGLNGQVEIRGINMEIMNSTNKISKLERGMCLIPEKFYPDTYLENNMDKNKIIDGENYIGQTLRFIIPCYQFGKEGIIEQTGEEIFDLLVADTYSTSDYLVNENVIYANFNDVYEMNTSNYNMPGSMVTENPLIVFADRSSNVNKIVKSINDKGFDSTIKVVYNDDFITMIKAVGMIICLISTVLSSVICGILLTRSINEIKTEIGLLKAIGFTNMKIGMLIINNIVIHSILGTINGAFVFLLLELYISDKLSIYSYWSKMDILINGNVLLMVATIYIMVTFTVAALSYFAIGKKAPLDLVK